MTACYSLCRKRIGIMTDSPHLVQGTVLNGGRSPSKKSLTPQFGHGTMRNCLRSPFESLTTRGLLARIIPASSVQLGISIQATKEPPPA